MDWINLHALWRIIVFGLIAGAGLPAVFALGLHFLSFGAKRPATVASGSAAAGSTEEHIEVGAPGAVISALCFAIFLAGIGGGIYYIVAGS